MNYKRTRRSRASSERTIAATEAAKTFGTLVDRVREAGAVYTIERSGVPVAQIGPVSAYRATVADFVALVKTELRHSDEYLRAVEAGVTAANTPAVPRNPWKRP